MQPSTFGSSDIRSPPSFPFAHAKRPKSTLQKNCCHVKGRPFFLLLSSFSTSIWTHRCGHRILLPEFEEEHNGVGFFCSKLVGGRFSLFTVHMAKHMFQKFSSSRRTPGHFLTTRIQVPSTLILLLLSSCSFFSPFLKWSPPAHSGPQSTKSGRPKKSPKKKTGRRPAQNRTGKKRGTYSSLMCMV